MANWINQQVQKATAAVGGFAGNAVNTVGEALVLQTAMEIPLMCICESGNGVAAGGRNVGENINGATRSWANAT